MAQPTCSANGTSQNTPKASRESCSIRPTTAAHIAASPSVPPKLDRSVAKVTSIKDEAPFMDGMLVGAEVGAWVGAGVGTDVGGAVGFADSWVGAWVGAGVGAWVGAGVGPEVGAPVVGARVG